MRTSTSSSTNQAPVDSNPNGLQAANLALEQGRLDEAIMRFEALADMGIVGSHVAFNRGIAYALRAKQAKAAQEGDLGNAAHAFEEVLRRAPHDREAQHVLNEVRREIARRDLASGARRTEVGSPPIWRSIVSAAPANVWVILSLCASLVATIAILLRNRLTRGAKLAATTVIVLGLIIHSLGTILGLASKHLRTQIVEATVVVPKIVAIPEQNGPPFDISEGTRVDVLEERATATKIKTEKGEGWVNRSSLRKLPPYRP